MAKLDLGNIRNIGIIAHIDAGKTTTTEHVLYYSGAKHRLGEVDAGTTDTDYDQEEQDRGITIYSACIPFTWRDCTVNLIDTPGHVDFTAEVERSLRVLDGCVVVFDAQKGVEAQSETVWRQADKYHVPRLVFVNKMDVVGANFDNVLAEIRERLEGRPVAVALPIGSGSPKDSYTPFTGTIDLIEMRALFFKASDWGKTIEPREIPAELLDEARRCRERLFDVLTERDEPDRLTTAYLEGRDIPAETIREAIREQTLRGLIQPVLCGSGREHIGIQPLMDAVTYYLPSPLDRPPVTGTNPKKKDKEEKRKPDPKEPFCGLVFKVVADPHGELFYLRIYSGTLKSQSRPWNPGKDRKEMVTKIYHVFADPTHREELREAYAGDIVALIGLKESVTGDTLCEVQHPILLEPIHFAETVVSRSIEPESSADKQKLTDTLNSLRREDPTFEWRVDPETGQTLMSGMGMLHLEIKQKRMERDFRLRVRVGKPRVSYRETLKRPVTVDGEFVRHAGTGGLFARVRVALEPVRGGQAVMVTSTVEPEALLPAYLTAAEQGIRGALQSGELGYPVINVRATILGGQMDAECSNEVAFEAAGADAVNKAMRDNVVLLEPVMHLEVTVPEEHLGAVTADLNARRAEISEVLTRGKLRVIEALVALARTFDYSEKVRSLSQGRADWTMEPHSYAPAPEDVLRGFLGTEEWS
ncbi:MAG TPA: elongation factor G [Gemmataceae bacterium]|jgi:elongation factor G|nr:elongation factor G [Gemmataceae bacterium]